MVSFTPTFWILVLLVLGLTGLVTRSVLRSRSRQRQLEEWSRQRRIEREREEAEEAERRRLAQEVAGKRLCTTHDQLAQAVERGEDPITIEGQLSKAYAGPDAVQQLGGGYRIALARHGKVVLRRG
jgi:hypothetical protein